MPREWEVLRFHPRRKGYVQFLELRAPYRHQSGPPERISPTILVVVVMGREGVIDLGMLYRSSVAECGTGSSREGRGYNRFRSSPAVLL